MSTNNLLQYNGPSVQADDTASNSTIVKRDSSGGIAGKAITGTSLVTTGALQVAAAAKTANFTADSNATFYECDATSGSIAATLPPAASVANQVYVFVKINSANSVVVTGNGSETINGSNTSTLSSQYSSLRIRSNGTAWYSF